MTRQYDEINNIESLHLNLVSKIAQKFEKNLVSFLMEFCVSVLVTGEYYFLSKPL